MSYYGNIECKECLRNTSFLIENERLNELKTIGDNLDDDIVNVIGKINCDHCMNENKVYIEKENNVIMYFKNEKGVKTGDERAHNVKEYEVFESPYENHPILAWNKFEINNNVYTIRKVWKRELTETNTEERFIEEIEDQYVYELIDELGKVKYATVTDDKQEHLYYNPEEELEELEEYTIDLEIKEYNGLLLDFLNLGLANEELIEITEENQFEEVIVEQKIGDTYLVIREGHKGYRGFLYDRTGIILYDMYKNDMEEILEEVNEIILSKNN